MSISDLPDQYAKGQNPMEVYHKSVPVAVSHSPGVSWLSRSSANANYWLSVCYGMMVEKIQNADSLFQLIQT